VLPQETISKKKSSVGNRNNALASPNIMETHFILLHSYQRLMERMGHGDMLPDRKPASKPYGVKMGIGNPWQNRKSKNKEWSDSILLAVRV